MWDFWGTKVEGEDNGPVFTLDTFEKSLSNQRKVASKIRAPVDVHFQSVRE